MCVCIQYMLVQKRRHTRTHNSVLCTHHKTTRANLPCKNCTLNKLQAIEQRIKTEINIYPHTRDTIALRRNDKWMNECGGRVRELKKWKSLTVSKNIFGGIFVLSGNHSVNSLDSLCDRSQFFHHFHSPNSNKWRKKWNIHRPLIKCVCMCVCLVLLFFRLHLMAFIFCWVNYTACSSTTQNMCTTILTKHSLTLSNTERIWKRNKNLLLAANNNNNNNKQQQRQK